jgi:peptidoglycan/LPS O-acetylase OafA/YrhL
MALVMWPGDQPLSAQPAEGGSLLPRHLPGIDLLRGLAAVGVTVGHLVQTATPGFHQRVGGATQTLGSWGVGIFFLISGFCIHAPTVRRELAGDGSALDLRAFYRRRFIRLYPAHLIALLLSITVAALLPLPAGAGETLLSVTTVPQFSAHVLMVHSFSKSAIFTGNSVLWTLAVETHFYLAYPLFLALRRRFGSGRVVLVLAVLSAVLTLVRSRVPPSLELVYTNAPYRWWEWILGCVLAERLLTRRPAFTVGWLAVLAAALGTLVIGIAIPHLRGGGMARTMVWPVLFAGTIVLAAWIGEARSGRVPGWLLTVGSASYSIYLVHPIAFHLALAASSAAGASPLMAVLGCVLAAIVVSSGFYKLIERPFATRALGKARAPAPALAVPPS